MADEEEEPSAAPASPVAEEPGSGGGGGGGGGGPAEGASVTLELAGWRRGFEAAIAANAAPSAAYRDVCREYEALFASHAAALRHIDAYKAQLADALESGRRAVGQRRRCCRRCQGGGRPAQAPH